MNEDSRWPIGTVVRLKSGGPWMTVDVPPQTPGDFDRVPHSENLTYTQWFVGEAPHMALQHGYFDAEVLEARTE